MERKEKLGLLMEGSDRRMGEGGEGKGREGKNVTLGGWMQVHIGVIGEYSMKSMDRIDVWQDCGARFCKRQQEIHMRVKQKNVSDVT